MKPLRYILLLLICMCMGYQKTQAQETDPVVVVVHPVNKITNISLNDLRLIYQGKKERWQDGQKILVLNRPAESSIRAKFYQKILGSAPAQQFFKPGSPVPFKPAVKKSESSVRRQVSRIQNTIGYMRLSKTDRRVKVITINNIGHKESKYALQ